MSVIIDNRLRSTNGVSVNIPYDINQLDLSGGRLQVKFDTRILDGAGSKFIIRHSDSSYRGFGKYVSPVMESSTEGISHVFTVNLTDEILQKSKFITVLTNGGLGTDKFDLEVTNIEISTLEHVQVNGSLFALKTYQMVKNGLGNTPNVDTGVLVISSEQAKPSNAEIGEVLLENDTDNVFYYDGTEWREFV